MAEGSGRYDEECESVAIETEATLCMLAVICGSKGSGFSISSRLPEDITTKEIPSLLRAIANDIENGKK